MDYGKIIRDSFAIAWSHKTLWILGIFAGYGGGFNTSFDKSDIEALGGTPMGGAFGGLGESPAEIWTALAPYLIGLTIFGLVFLAMHCIASPGLVDAVNRITRGGKYTLSESFSTGIDFFWRTLGMLILFAVVTIVSIVVLVVIVIVSWAIAVPLGVITLLLALPLGFVLFFAALTIYNLGLRAMVARNVSIGDAIAEGYALLRTHLGKSIVMFLISIGLGLALGIASLIIAAMVMAPIGLFAYGMGLAVWQAFLVAIILSLPITIPVGGYMGTFHSSTYTLFYFGLVEPQGPQYAAPQTSAGYSPTV
jgi:hypothetical protein